MKTTTDADYAYDVAFLATTSAQAKSVALPRASCKRQIFLSEFT